MEFLFDHSRDWFRLVVLLVLMLAFVGLIYRRFNPPNDNWNQKTKDYWFALMMWTVAGFAATVESLINNQDYSLRLMFTLAAAMASLNGLRKSGSWTNES